MNEKNVKAIISLLIVLMAFSVLLLFYNYQENLMTQDNFYPFMILTFVGMGLLLGLLFLVNKQHHPVKAVKAAHSVSKSSRKPAKKKRK